MAQKKTKVIGASLFDEQIAIVKRESRLRGLFNISATIREIINEWEQDRGKQRVKITEAGRKALQEEESKSE